MELENLFMFDYKVDVVLLTYEQLKRFRYIDSNTLPNILVIQALGPNEVIWILETVNIHKP